MNEMSDAISIVAEEYFTPKELSNSTKLSPDAIRRMFVDEPGVIRIGHPTSRKKRQYYTLRIPAGVVERVFSRMKVRGS